jgi:peptidoglycan lytic transglycosylase G
MARRGRLLLTLSGLVLVVLLASAGWYEVESHAWGAAGPRVVIEVNTGESFSSVTAKLAQTKVIGSSLAFRISDLIHGTPTVLPGDYSLHQNESFSQVRALLSAGPNVFAVTVDPGLTLHEVGERVDDTPGHNNGSFAVFANSGVVHSTFSAPGSNNLEGLLGTGTYLVEPGESDTTILTDMVQRFEAQAAAAGLDSTTAAALGMTPYQLVTVASIVQKEGYYDKNMPDVSRVIYNRLSAGTPLQMDSTVLYSLGQDGGAVTPQDLKLQTPYNSYLNKGLPPTPICSPSVNALSAAAHPPAGGWLFFEVVDKSGTEAFADTFAEQLANEKLAQSRGLG